MSSLIGIGLIWLCILFFVNEEKIGFLRILLIVLIFSAPKNITYMLLRHVDFPIIPSLVVAFAAGLTPLYFYLGYVGYKPSTVYRILLIVFCCSLGPTLVNSLLGDIGG